MEKHARTATGNPERTSAGIPTRAYWCDVLAEGEVYGTRETVPYVLGTFPTISPKLALRWLQSEAERIADRLDPDPERSAWVKPWTQVGTVPVPDCPTEFRFWIEDPDEHHAAGTETARPDHHGHAPRVRYLPARVAASLLVSAG
ncbi:hypothetical protein ACFYT4_08420 [Streptomyces sp. NPDC004609]|uniref:hypothetical protein n=1 Tax=Streptomyces sp. NPDC004609 TaxID=3364704 RepID=UPI0036BA21FB